MEIWKTVPGYEGLYEVSSLGNVRSLNYRKSGKPQERKLGIHPNGYFQLYLWKEGIRKKYDAHQLVAMAFLGHIPNGINKVVDHINENGFDNRVENLRIVSHRENISICSSFKKNGLPTGVQYRTDRDKYQSAIMINGKLKYLGIFKTIKEASEAYKKALKEII
jgi:hypothetical protein